MQDVHVDALTGCADRHRFMELAHQELARVRRDGGDLSVLVLDLDRFKSVNDQFGRGIGDLALRRLAEVCRSTLRGEDVIGRIGGEAFAVLLPQTGSEMAFEAAERLREAVAESEIPLERNPPLHITASIGVATLASWENGFEPLLSRADEALYEAKSGGRNQVVAARTIERVPG